MTYELGVEVERLALNFDQVEEYRPPPNPTKLKDSRAMDYITLYGMESWELDALEPQVLDGMISGAIEQFMDLGLYERMVEREEGEREAIREAARLLEERE